MIKKSLIKIYMLSKYTYFWQNTHMCTHTLKHEIHVHTHTQAHRAVTDALRNTKHQHICISKPKHRHTRSTNFRCRNDICCRALSNLREEDRLTICTRELTAETPPVLQTSCGNWLVKTFKVRDLIKVTCQSCSGQAQQGWAQLLTRDRGT